MIRLAILGFLTVLFWSGFFIGRESVDQVVKCECPSLEDVKCWSLEDGFIRGEGLTPVHEADYLRYKKFTEKVSLRCRAYPRDGTTPFVVFDAKQDWIRKRT